MQLNKFLHNINSAGMIANYSFKLSKKAFLLDRKFYWIIENQDGSTNAVMSFIDEKKNTFFDFTTHSLSGKRK